MANEDGICDSGRYDAPLSQQGKMLALYHAERFPDCPDAIYASDMQRASGTAAIYAYVLKQRFGRDVPVILVPALRGQDEGSIEGLPYHSAAYRMLKSLAKDKPGSIGGEDLPTALGRQLRAFGDIDTDIKAKGFENVLVVTHSDTMARLCFAIGSDALAGENGIENCQAIGPFDSGTLAARASAFLQYRQKSYGGPRI